MLNENINTDDTISSQGYFTLRFLFEKTGGLIYISHLDLARTFSRIFVRAGLPLWHTEGFNPHPKLVFSTPLSVGSGSFYELLDVRFKERLSCGSVLDALRVGLPEGINIKDAYYPETKFSDIKYSAYELVFRDKRITRSTANEVKALFAKPPLTVLKRTKKGERETDVFPLIKSFECTSKEEELYVSTVLCASSEDFLNPEYITGLLRRSFSFPDPDNLSGSFWSVYRTCLFNKEMEQFR